MIAAKINTEVQKPRLSASRCQVTRSRAERERREHRRPVEPLPPRGIDLVNRQRSLAAIPEEEDCSGDECEHRRGDLVADPCSVTNPVGHHRSEDCDHHDRKPVVRRPILLLAQLQPQRQNHSEDADEPGQRHALLTQEVRHCLTHPGRQQLQHPEYEGDLRDLSQELTARARVAHSPSQSTGGSHPGTTPLRSELRPRSCSPQV